MRVRVETRRAVAALGLTLSACSSQGTSSTTPDALVSSSRTTASTSASSGASRSTSSPRSTSGSPESSASSIDTATTGPTSTATSASTDTSTTRASTLPTAWIPLDAGVDPACPPQLTAQGPLVITDANYGTGSFTGHWVSTDPGTPAVSIQTSQPVTLKDCIVSGPGNLIEADANPVDLTVESCAGTGVVPAAAGLQLGCFVYGQAFSQLTVEHSAMQNLAFGVYVSWGGSATPPSSITVRYNLGVNMNGQYSDGSGGFQSGNARNFSHFIQVANLTHAPHIELAWNFALEQPGMSSVDDNINIFQSSGTAASPISIHDNFLYGGYNYPATVMGYTGGGIITDQGTSFTTIDDNQVLNNANYGVSLYYGAGNNSATGNHMVSTGCFPGQGPDGGYYGDTFGNGGEGTTLSGNLSGWNRQPSSGGPPTMRSDYWSTGTGVNQSLSPAGSPVTVADEAAEGAAWLRKVADAGVTIGPLCP